MKIDPPLKQSSLGYEHTGFPRTSGGSRESLSLRFGFDKMDFKIPMLIKDTPSNFQTRRPLMLFSIRKHFASPGLRVALPILFASLLMGCGGEPDLTHNRTAPIATGTLVKVNIWARPVMRPGELGENSSSSPPEGSRIELYDQFILITLPNGRTILSLNGWYSDLSFKRDK